MQMLLFIRELLMAIPLPAGIYDQFPLSLELKLTKPPRSEDATG